LADGHELQCSFDIVLSAGENTPISANIGNIRVLLADAAVARCGLPR